MTLMDKACYERGCACYDVGDEHVEVVAVTEQKTSECQYAKDVCMPEHRCVDKCYYEKYPQPQREWVGLTVSEMEELTLIAGRMDYTHMLQLAEAKLKEKNA
jgi:hypothetical protein